MKTWVEVVGGRVRHKFETADDVRPEFGPPVIVVDVTNRTPQPEIHWLYDARTDTFTAASRPPKPIDQNTVDAAALSATSGAFTAEQTSSALRLTLRKLYSV